MAQTLKTTSYRNCRSPKVWVNKPTVIILKHCRNIPRLHPRRHPLFDVAGGAQASICKKPPSRKQFVLHMVDVFAHSRDCLNSLTSLTKVDTQQAFATVTIWNYLQFWEQATVRNALSFMLETSPHQTLSVLSSLLQCLNCSHLGS